MTDNTLEDSLLRPVQEEGQQKTPATLEMLADLLHKNPDLLPLLQTQGRGNAISRRLQPITSALAAVACGSYSWIRFLVVFLLTALFNVVNLKPEIPKESRVVLDKIERDLGDLKRKHEKVLHDKTRMEEKVLPQFAFLFFFFSQIILKARSKILGEIYLIKIYHNRALKVWQNKVLL